MKKHTANTNEIKCYHLNWRQHVDRMQEDMISEMTYTHSPEKIDMTRLRSRWKRCRALLFDSKKQIIVMEE